MKKYVCILYWLTYVQLVFVSSSYAQLDSIYDQGVYRKFILHLPSGYSAANQYPLVMDFHGMGSDAATQQIYSQLDNVADNLKFIVVYPNAISGNWDLSGSSDVNFVSHLIDTIRNNYSCNAYLFSTGMSMGGFMTYKLACALPQPLTAIAVVAGNMTQYLQNTCAIANGLPMMHFHGTADNNVYYNGELGIPPVETTISWWVDQNNCNTTPVVTAIPDINTGDNSTVEKYYYGGGIDGSEVTFYKIINGGHTWPGAIPVPSLGNTNQDISASTLMGNFFIYFCCTAAPAQPSTITVTGGNAKVCPGETRTYTITAATGCNFNWTVPAGATITGGQGTNTINVTYGPGFTASGTLSVVKTNGCGSSAQRNLTINRNNPAATITTQGPATFCSGTNPLTLISNAGTGLMYQWKKGANNISGATNQNYIPTATATAYKVVVTNASGCSKTSAGVAVTVNPLPAATITALGPVTFCAGGSVVLQANSGTGLTYQWRKGNVDINGATLQNYTATTGGTYKVTVTNSNNCSKISAGKTVTINCRLSNSDKGEVSMQLFPNPASGTVTLKYTSQEDQQGDLIIAELTGRAIISQQVVLSTGENELVVDISSISNGVYLVRLKLPQGETTGRIVKE